MEYSNILDDTSIIIKDVENEALNLSQKKAGKKKDKVWYYFNIIDISNNSHKGAVCKFYSQSWQLKF